MLVNVKSIFFPVSVVLGIGMLITYALFKN